MPPTKAERKQNLKKIAALRSEGTEAKLEYTPQVKFGLNHVTNLVQRKEAQVVLIAHDVMPLELVVWLPTLCYKMGVPFIIVKGKSQLGQLVRMKNATCVALTKIRSGDQNELQNLIDSAKTSFNEKFEKSRTMPSLPTMGLKTQHKLKKKAMKAAQ
jgi:large subunit ribosomal protein L7Ae